MATDSAEWRRRLDRLRLRREQAEAEVASLEASLAETREDASAWVEAQTLVQGVAQIVQESAHSRLESVVTRCLRAVYDAPYVFRIRFDRSRGRTEATFSVSRGGAEVDPIEAGGLGVAEVAAFGLRVGCLILHRPPLRRVLVLDEPFSWLDAAARERASEMVRRLAAETGVQFLIVTHDPAFMAGRVVEVGR